MELGGKTNDRPQIPYHHDRRLGLTSRGTGIRSRHLPNRKAKNNPTTLIEEESLGCGGMQSPERSHAAFPGVARESRLISNLFGRLDAHECPDAADLAEQRRTPVKA